MMRFFYRIVLSCGLYVCLTLQSCKTSGEANQSTQALRDSTRIVFAVFHAQKDTIRNITSMRLVEIKQSPGSLKRKPQHVNTSLPYLGLYLMRGDTPVDSLLHEHPLEHEVDYVSSDGTLMKKVVTQNEAEFFVRLQVPAGSHLLRILEFDSRGHSVELTTISL